VSSLEDSQEYSCVIHERSADSELTDAPLRPSGRSMGQEQGYFCPAVKAMSASPRRITAIRRGRSLPLSRRHTLARPAPERFGDPIKIHTRFSALAKSGAWKNIFEMLAADADNEYAMIDSTIVRRTSAQRPALKKDGEDQAIGRSKGGLSTNPCHRSTPLEIPLAFFLTAGQAHDLQGADVLLPQMQADILLAGQGFRCR